MSVSTYPATWPTEASFKTLEEALGTAFNELEGVVGYLRSVVEGPDGGGWSDGWPDPLPTFETVGVLWNAIDEIRVDLAQCTTKADELEKLLDEVNAIRRDGPLQREADDAR